MRITERTKYSQIVGVEKYLTPAAKEELKRAAERAFKSMPDLTFAEYWSACNGKPEKVLGKLTAPTVLQVYWLKRLQEYTEEFAQTLKALQIPQTIEEKTAVEIMRPSSFAESILVFVRGYFGLPSFSAAEQITLGEILIAKKAAYNEAVYRRKLQALQMQKFKTKK